MADDDLGDIFASVDETMEEHEQRQLSTNPMAQKEAEKLAQSSAFVENFLKRQFEDEDKSAGKRTRLEVDDYSGHDEGYTRSFAQRVTIHTVHTDNENCSHEVAYPPGIEFTALRPASTEPAKNYPFRLDSFQREAILCIENAQSVLVSAHTSAGKTVVAQYAIAQALRDKQRVIYTSPIKALSNQKYRELEEEFRDVGLMTGDVTLNPDASCLVMTTEILRSMMFRGSEIMREVGWVVFDEIHYMRDKERGVVWEETIILLPRDANFVFLSATIPNARQFAEWISWLKVKPCHVVYTDYRPTPLVHYVYPVGGSNLYEAVNVKGMFNEKKFAEAMAQIPSAGDAAKGGVERGRRGGAKPDSTIQKIIRSLKERDLVPCIVFSFSRRDCEGYALSIKDMCFNTDSDKHIIREIFRNATEVLSEEDRKLPQINQLLPMLLNGVGVHHSGLLPILKEVTEILFGEGLIKVLFATETFSMGLNMPARTVVFTSARKYDGKDFRPISSGEYIQMSGRAGRRGKDDRGTVILMMDQQMKEDEIRQIVKGATDPLNSQFRLTYNMVLNLLRVEGINPEYMLEHSFHQFQNNAKLPELSKKLESVTDVIAKMNIPRETDIKAYFNLEKTIADLKQEIQSLIMVPKNIIPMMQAGRLLHVKALGYDFDWGALVNYHRMVNPSDATEYVFVLEILLRVSNESAQDVKDSAKLRPPVEGETGCWEIIPLMLACVTDLSSIRVKFPKSLKSKTERNYVGEIILEAKKRFANGLPRPDPVKDMDIKDNRERVPELIKSLETSKKRFEASEVPLMPEFNEAAALYKEKLAKEEEVATLKTEIRKITSILIQKELQDRIRVLRRLEFCDSNNIVTDKGRVACEIAAADELLMTEMLFSNAFTSKTDGEVAAIVSCFVFQEKTPTGKLKQNLREFLQQLQEQARRIAKLSRECKIELDEGVYIDSFKPGLMPVVEMWAEGKSFSEIVTKTDVFEGSIIRCLRRLEEVLRELIGASHTMGNDDLAKKFKDARAAIKRDIVFAASLYL